MEKAIEKLKEEFEKSPYVGKVIINQCLLPQIKNDSNFAERILLKEKSVLNMLNHIQKWVRLNNKEKSMPYAAPNDDVVYSLAIHYYQEDDPAYVPELLEEEPIEFGNIKSEMEKPIIKYITGTITKVIEKEVIKKTPSKKIAKKVKENVEQLSIFEV
jgi:hypothetical protein